MSDNEQLTHKDVERLLTDPSPDTRAVTAAKVARHFDASGLSDSERGLAEEIIRLMAHDAAARVRQSLSENLKYSTNLPHDVAMRLARDVEEVALPIISYSQVLNDGDLLEVIRSGSAAKQVAVAVRPTVSAEIADVLVREGDERVVAALVGNEGASIADTTLEKAVDRFGTSLAVQEPLVHRSRLPVTVSERLVALVSEKLQEYLVTHHELPAGTASDLLLRSRERATVALVAEGTDEESLEKLVLQLFVSGRLTPSLLVRAVCMGDVAFFEAGIAQLARIPLANARVLIHDGGSLGLKALFDRANLPAALLPATRVALDVIRETQFDGEPHDMERHRRKVLERILTQYEALASEDLEYLLGKLGDLIRPSL